MDCTNNEEERYGYVDISVALNGVHFLSSWPFKIRKSVSIFDVSPKVPQEPAVSVSVSEWLGVYQQVADLFVRKCKMKMNTKMERNMPPFNARIQTEMTLSACFFLLSLEATKGLN